MWKKILCVVGTYVRVEVEDAKEFFIGKGMDIKVRHETFNKDLDEIEIQTHSGKVTNIGQTSFTLKNHNDPAHMIYVPYANIKEVFING